MTATLCYTKAGKGFKVVINGKWFYTSKYELYRMLNRKQNACLFREIEDPVTGKVNEPVLEIIDSPPVQEVGAEVPTSPV